MIAPTQAVCHVIWASRSSISAYSHSKEEPREQATTYFFGISSPGHKYSWSLNRLLHVEWEPRGQIAGRSVTTKVMTDRQFDRLLRASLSLASN